MPKDCNPVTLARRYDRQELQDRLYNGEAVKDIAADLGVTEEWLCEVCGALGLPKYYDTRWARNPTRDKALELRRRGFSAPVISRLLRTPQSTVEYWATMASEKFPRAHIRMDTYASQTRYVLATLKELGIDLATPPSR